LEDTRKCIERWILTLADAIEGNKFLGLECAKIPRHTTEIDTRNVKLLEDSLTKLPTPVKTLIEALGKIKLNITEEKCRNRTNYESAFISELESAVMYTKKSMEFLNTENNEIKKNLRFSLTMFQKEIFNILEIDCNEMTYEKVKEIQDGLLEKSRKLRTQMESDLKTDAVKQPLHRTAPQYNSVLNAEEAVQQSKQVMNRIRILNTGGPVDTYFEVPKLKIQQNYESEARIDARPIKKEPDSQLLKNCIHLRRRIKLHCDSIEADNKILFDDAVHSCVLGLRQIKIQSLTKQDTALNETLLAADKKIQQEIKFLLEILTVDRIYLDQALRCIRATCDNHEEMVRRDMINSFVIKLTQWRKSLEETYYTI
jgi:hypothetical protein